MAARVRCGCSDYRTDFNHGFGFEVFLFGGKMIVMVVMVMTMVIMIMVMVVDSISVAFGG